MTRFTAALVLALTTFATACDETSYEFEEGPTVELLGQFERIDPNNPDSIWIGSEILVVREADGSVVCEESLALDAFESATENCSDCDLTLEVIRTELQALAEACDPSHSVSDRGITGQAYLRFEEGSRKSELRRGTISIADSSDGPWFEYSRGISYDGVLIYRNVDFLDVAE